MRLRRPALALTLVALLAPAAPAAEATTSSGTPSDRVSCAQGWGSLPEGSEGRSTAEVADIRAGRHACFDRLVLDVDGALGRWDVRYVDGVRRDGSGEPVPLRGGARLRITLDQPPVHTDAWFLPNGELCDTSRFGTFRHVAWAGGSEGRRTSIGLGVRARLPFRVLPLEGPGPRSRLVVDVAHRW